MQHVCVLQILNEEVKTAVEAALDAGYRHIDTAYNYKNEDAIGEVLQEHMKAGKVKREDLFIVTKVIVYNFRLYS
jgi:alcohol dehydrogenase (NADP+)